MTSDRCDLLCLDLPKAEAVRRDLPSAAELEAAAAEAKALSDPTRLQLALALRRGGELCVCDLAWLSGRQDKIVSHHVRQMRAAGLARSRREGRMVMYALTPRGEAMVDAVTTAAPPVPRATAAR